MNPFDDPTDYGTVSGASTGFRGRPGAQEFSARKNRISNSIMTVNQQTQSLRDLQTKLGTVADNDSLRRRIHNLLRDTKEKLQESTSQLSELVEVMRGGADQGQNLAVQSLRQNIEKAAREFTQVFESIRDRMQSQPLTPSDGKGYLDSDHQVEVADDSARLLRREEQERRRPRQAQAFMDAGEVDIAEERAERMQDLEADIVELHGIMGQIGGMVVEQGEGIVTIEAAVESAAGGVLKANEQLGSAVSYKRCSRKLTCIICTILLVILIIIIAIIAIVVAVNTKK